MRFTAVVFVLVVSMAVISPSYSSPVPSQDDSAGTKRFFCQWAGCRIAEVPSPGHRRLHDVPTSARVSPDVPRKCSSRTSTTGSYRCHSTDATRYPVTDTV
ncbi:hypothetical protein BGY98DRAFT_129025 [Russula aff. rugulosa BPL654]|nr:hypothetical protein BGY98DRAFT_129025 [Russula aff. rugulosa BPL654]